MNKQKLKVKNQHYIPQFLLKNFIDDNEGFCVYQIKEKIIIKNTGTNRFAAIKRLYDLDEEQLKFVLSDFIKLYPNSFNDVDFTNENFIENYLARIEADVSQLFNRILQHDHLVLSENDKLLILQFLFDLSFRTLFYKRTIENIRNGMSPKLVEFARAAGINDYNIEEQLDELFGSSHIDYMFDIRKLFEFVNTIMTEYEFCYAKNETGFGFILSDNPAYQISIGLSDFCFPISSKRAIVLRRMYPKKLVCKIPNHSYVMNLDKSDVIIYNLWNSIHSDLFIFGEYRSLKIIGPFTEYKELEVI